jgi:hypothetical protein
LLPSTAFLKVYDLLEASRRGDGDLQTGFRSRDHAVIAICVAVFCTTFLFVCIGLMELYHHGKVRTLRLRATDLPPQLELAHGMRYHVFLSHVWSSGQDQAAVIKHMLQLLLPGVRVFLGA